MSTKTLPTTAPRTRSSRASANSGEQQTTTRKILLFLLLLAHHLGIPQKKSATSFVCWLTRTREEQPLSRHNNAPWWERGPIGGTHGAQGRRRVRHGLQGGPLNARLSISVPMEENDVRHSFWMSFKKGRDQWPKSNGVCQTVTTRTRG